MASKPRKPRKLRAAVKAILEPALAGAGFTLAYPNFRRAVGDRFHLAEFQIWKDGGAFTLWFAEQAGPFTDWSGRVLPPEELTVSHLPPERRGALRRPVPPNLFMAEHWFAHAAIQDDRPALDALVGEVAGYLPQMEAWFRNRSIGLNVFALPPQ